MAQSHRERMNVANILIDFAQGQGGSLSVEAGTTSSVTDTTTKLNTLDVGKREREESAEPETVKKRVRREGDERGQREGKKAEETNETEGTSSDSAPAFRVVWNKRNNNANEVTSTLDGSYPRRLDLGWQHDYRMHALRREAIEKSASFPMLERLCNHADIVLNLTTQFLEPEDLLTLYTLSKRFHYQVNSRYTTYMLCSARKWARLLPDKFLREVPAEEGTLWGTVSAYDANNGSSTSQPNNAGGSSHSADPPQNDAASLEERRRQRFLSTLPVLDPMAPTRPGETNIWDITTLLPFNQYVHLCTIDPTLRALNTNPDTTDTRTRHVPTFRYLFFLTFRARTVQTIMTVLKQIGHPLPVTTTPVLIKLWFLMDLPTTNLRAGLLKNATYITDHDLQILVMFFIKLDMVFSDPLDGDTFGPAGTGALRQCILAQRSLSTLASVLTRKSMKTTIDMLKLKVKWNYTPRPQHRGMSILGVPAKEVGAMRWEYWTSPWMMERPERAGLLMGLEEGVLREGIRRGLGLEKLFGKSLTYGY